jgi:hypothetical protein
MRQTIHLTAATSFVYVQETYTWAIPVKKTPGA